MTALRQADFFPDAGLLRASVATLAQSYVWFYPRLIPLAGGHKGALMLANMLHWTRHLQQQAPEREGWLWKTHEQWGVETGLSRHEIDAAKVELVRKALLQQVKRGMPARTYSRLNLNVLAEALSGLLQLPAHRRITWNWENSAAMLQLLGRPTAFYVHLARMLDSATDALHLSFLIQSQRTHMTAAITPEWISPRAQQINERLGLTYKQQLASRKRLAKAGLIDYRMSGSMTPRPEVRVCFGRVAEGLQCEAKNRPSSDSPRVKAEHAGRGPQLGFARVGSSNTPAPAQASVSEVTSDGSSITPRPWPNRQTGAASQPSEQQFTFSANRDLPFRQTGNAQTGKQEFPFSEDMVAEKGSLYIYKIHTQQQPQESSLFGKQADGANSSGGCGAIDFTGVDQQWHVLARDALQASGLNAEICQSVADEWIGRFTDKRQQALGYPLRYLQRLIDSAQGGQFVPELGIAVAAARQSRQRAQRMLAKASPVSAAIPKAANSEALPASATQSEAIARERARLQMLAQEFRIRRHRDGGSSTTPPQVHAAVTGDGSSITSPQVHAAVTGDGSSITSPQVHAAVTGDGSSITSPRSIFTKLKSRVS